MFLCALLMGARGAAYLVILPPFEGWDEYQHLAYVHHVRKHSQSPVLTETLVDPSLYSPLLEFPHPSQSLDQLGAIGARGYGDDNQRKALPSEVARQIPLALYQAQHPPLYYLLASWLAPGESTRSLTRQILVLRSMNVALGVLTLLLFARILNSMGGSCRFAVLLLLASQPLFLLNSARVANDALAIFWATAALATLICPKSLTAKHALLIGLLLAAGAWTKATVLALAPVTLIGLVVKAWRQRRRQGFENKEGAELGALSWLSRCRIGVSSSVVSRDRSPQLSGADAEPPHPTLSLDGERVKRSSEGRPLILSPDGERVRRSSEGRPLILGGIAALTFLVLVAPRYHFNLQRFGMLEPIQEAVINRDLGRGWKELSFSATQIDWWFEYSRRYLRHSLWVGGWSFVRASRFWFRLYQALLFASAAGGVLALWTLIRSAVHSGVGSTSMVGAGDIEDEARSRDRWMTLLALAIGGIVALSLSPHMVQTFTAAGRVGTNIWYATVSFPWLLWLVVKGWQCLPGRATSIALTIGLVAVQLGVEVDGALLQMPRVYGNATFVGAWAALLSGSIARWDVGSSILVLAMLCAAFAAGAAIVLFLKESVRIVAVDIGSGDPSVATKWQLSRRRQRGSAS